MINVTLVNNMGERKKLYFPTVPQKDSIIEISNMKCTVRTVKYIFDNDNFLKEIELFVEKH